MWFDGGTPEDPPQEKPEQPTPNETGGTQEPQKIAIEGLGELTPKQIGEKLQGYQMEQERLLRALNEQGRDKNDLKHRLEANEDTIRQLQYRLDNPPEPTVDWRKFDDPSEKINALGDAIFNQMKKDRMKNEERWQNLSAKEKAQLQAREDQQWTDIGEDYLDRLGAPDDPRSRKLLHASLAIEVGQTDRRYWTPEVFRKAAKNAIDEYNAIKRSGQTELIDTKKKDDKLKTGSPGKAPAPEKRKYVPGMSRKERDEILFKNAPE